MFVCIWSHIILKHSLLFGIWMTLLVKAVGLWDLAGAQAGTGMEWVGLVGGDEDGGFLAANYLFVFMTAVSSAPFEEPGIMRTPASHNMFSLL